jgi:hypothetical protein
MVDLKKLLAQLKKEVPQVGNSSAFDELEAAASDDSEGAEGSPEEEASESDEEAAAEGDEEAAPAPKGKSKPKMPFM